MPKPRKWPKRLAYAFTALAGALAVTYLFMHVVATFRMERKFPLTHETIDIPATPDAIARGQHIVEAVAHCSGCHGADFGGKTMVESFALGRLVAPNLTSGKGGIGARYAPEDWLRALRHGLDPTGHALKVMPSDVFTNMSRRDLGAVIAYMRQVPPVDHDPGNSSIGPLARVLYVTNQIKLVPAEHIDHEATARFEVPAGPTPAYGRYLAENAGCLHCHGEKLEGAPSPAPGFPARPALANLGRRGWAEGDFVRALREGVRPNGTRLDNEMPWRALGQMSDEELRALWLFLNDSPAPAPATARL